MARSRVELDRILRSTLGTSNVYFDPPESFKLKYPCIVYSLGSHYEVFADDKLFINMKRYTLEQLRYCHLSRPYVADGLFHYAYDIYF